ncbi:SidA/IucD/PvdA family monooxygenase [Pseudothauera rhizosphaerae]|nr:NAD(P)/FAD-dependent oxidoreductase [Pseudothauera rhizosphaerae]
MSTLQQLQEDVERSFRWSAPLPPNWVPETPGADHDAVIVGGGQTGVAIVYGLRRLGITRVKAIDQAPEGEAGIWTTTARMNLLRTSKFLPGPEYGNPLLSFRAWFETQHGAAAFDALTRIARTDWAAYLAWYQRTVGVQVQHGTRLLDIEALENGLLRLHLEADGRLHTETTRKLVLATGFGGGGEDNIPAAIRALPKPLWAHTSEHIDFTLLKGKTVGIVGAGPSAFDAAGVALENGARAVHLFSRRGEIHHQPESPPGAAPGPFPPARQPGAMEHFHRLPDGVRWRYHLLGKGAGASTPIDSIDRATAFENFHIHLNTTARTLETDGDKVHIQIGDEPFALDFVIAGTGFRIDLASRPELSLIVDDIALWKDRYTPRPGEEYPEAGLYPYLGEGFEFTEKIPGQAPYLANIHCYNWAAALSSGKNLSDVPSMPELPRLLSGISRGLFFADLDHHADRITAKGGAGADPSVYAKAVWPLRRNTTAA